MSEGSTGMTQREVDARFANLTGRTLSFEQLAIRQQLRLLDLRTRDEQRWREQKRDR